MEGGIVVIDAVGKAVGAAEIGGCVVASGAVGAIVVILIVGTGVDTGVCVTIP